jgi:hypothetical protein
VIYALLAIAVQWCESGMTIPDPDFFSIPDQQQQKRGGENIISLLTFFAAINSTKM